MGGGEGGGVKNRQEIETGFAHAVNKYQNRQAEAGFASGTGQEMCTKLVVFEVEVVQRRR